MADEKAHAEVHSATQSFEENAVAERPTGWMYRAPKWFPYYYASPEVQILLVAFTCFLCPGMFNAINGLGGAGQVDPKASDDSNTAVYATFAVVGFFAGSICNTVGVRWSLAFGGFGYSVYVASYLSYNHTQNYGFTVFAGFLLGLCAGVLWAAQGAIMMSYPNEKQKGRYISYFWVIFNLGGVIGSLVPLGQNINATDNAGVNDGTYIGFLVLTLLGAAMAFTLVDAKRVVRRDGSRIILMKNPTWKSEIWGLWETLRSDSYIVLLFPMFFSSNWFYTYQFNGVNFAQFDLRTRSLNNVLYWTAQMISATIFGYALDISSIRRTVRAKIVWCVLFALTFAIWGGGYAFQKGYTRELVSTKGYVKLDWTSNGYVGPMFLYLFYGFYDAAWQTCVYWFMGSMTNNSRKLANFAGFYKGIQSAGAAIIFAVDTRNPSYMSEFISCWVLLAASLVVAAPVMLLKIKDTVPLEEDLKFSDETVADVLGQKPDTGRAAEPADHA